ncbi:MAG: hypothetical protein ACI4IQ_00590 [Eubacterium sp.]
MSVKTKKTPKKIFKIFLKAVLAIICVIVFILAVLAAISAIGAKSNSNFIKSLEPVSYEEQLTPQLDEDGYYTFTTDEDFKVLQLSDVHIGGGFLSIKKILWR